MKAIQITQTGGPEVLNLVDIPTPKPMPNEVLVQIKAAGVNFVDIYFREGRYPAQLPLVLGQEAAGVVVETGSDVKQIKTGDRVAYSAAPGAYAEYAAVPAHVLVKIPEKLDFEQAAAAMLQGMTAHYLCRSTYPLKRGETALIHAAAGGVGLLLVQMVHQIGARIIATVSSEEKAALARSAGADHVVLYTQSDFETETKKITANEGVHVVYDSVGKTTFDKGLNVLRRRGHMVLFGGSSGPVPPLDLILLSQKGSLFVTRPTLADYIATREELEWRAGEVLGMVAEGKLKVRIAHRYPLAQAQLAHRELQGRKTTGKLLLLP